MPYTAYQDFNFRPATLAIIDRADQICREYAAQGYTLTLRQVYYQFVSRGWLDNKQTEYKRLGGILNDARLAGMLDWNHMEDRTRNVRSLSHWDSPKDVILSAARSYRIDKWANQAYHVEVWIEKDALVGVIQGVCTSLDVPYFSCRGYTSQSEIWSAGQRFTDHVINGKNITVIHLGDHDPSGIDMTRDIGDRLNMFVEHETGVMDAVRIERIALNWDQVTQYQPPPNPAKDTDSRAVGYVAKYGNESWELDALEPTVIGSTIEDAVYSYRDQEQWDADVARENAERSALRETARNWTT